MILLYCCLCHKAEEVGINRLRSTSKDTGAGAWTQRRKTNDGKEDCDWKDTNSIRT